MARFDEERFSYGMLWTHVKQHDHINSALKQQGHGFKFKLHKQSATNKTFSHHVQFFRTENTQTQKETQTRGFTRKKIDPQLPPRPEECMVLAVWFLWGSLCAWPLPFGPPWALLAGRCGSNCSTSFVPSVLVMPTERGNATGWPME